MKRKRMKNLEIEKLQKLLVKDAGLREALDFAKAGSAAIRDLAADKPERIRVPYVNSPNLLERRWK